MGTRYVIIDYMHLAFKTKVCTPLSWKMRGLNGEPVVVDTTIPTYTIKNIWKYSGYGRYHTAVCLEGGCPTRKAYFSSLTDKATEPIKYKDGRQPIGSAMIDGVNLTTSLLHSGGVSLYREMGFEADDYIGSLVKAIKDAGITDPIDIITGDRDMLPLVDNQVSVYIKSTREYNEAGCPALRGYYQVTPDSWDTYIYYASAYKGFKLPYNTVLLYKMLHGDSSDNIPALVKGYGGKKFSAVVEKMEESKIPFDKLFRYGNADNEDFWKLMHLFFSEDVVDGMQKIYKGIDLMPVKPQNGSITIPKIVDYGLLQRALSDYHINLPVGK